MRRWCVLGGILVTLAFPFSSLPALAAELIYVPLPIESQTEVVAAHTPLVRYLEGRLGRSIKIQYEKNYGTILQLFSEGKIDLVQLGPYPLVNLRKKYPPAVPLAVINESAGQPTYTCALVASFDGPSSKELVTGQLALPQELSTCGLFAARLLFANHHPALDQMGYEYMGNHSNVALAVTRGEFQAGVMKSGIARKYANLALKILAETQPFPGFVIVGNQATLGDELMQKISEELLKVDYSTRSSWGIGHDGFSAVHSEELLQLEELGPVAE